MDRTIKKYLFDIGNAINEIESFMESRPKMFETFLNDLIFKRAVERNLEIIGEAMTRALKLMPDLKITSARNIVNTRNYVIHAYDTLSEEILWGIVINDLPVLKAEVFELINTED